MAILKRLVPLFLLIGFLLPDQAVQAGGIENPNFQPNLKHWKTRGKVLPAEGEAHLTPTVEVPTVPGARAATISQEFDCAGSGDCYVKFKYWIRDLNSVAMVRLTGGVMDSWFVLPPNSGLPTQTQVSISGCHANAKIEFLVVGYENKVALELDQITDKCSNLPWSNIPQLLPTAQVDPHFQDLAASPLSRYTHENFDSIQIASLTYGSNISVLTGAPTQESLAADLYFPANDTLTARPLVILVHSGEFLPLPFNSRTSGSITDSSIVEIATRLSQRGYAVAAIDYRLGWSPVSSSQAVRTRTFLEAIYRGIQDVRSAIRYFKADAVIWGIDTNRVAVGGLGTGGYLAYGAATLDDYAEMAAVLPLDTSLLGNVWATNNRPLCIANNPGFGSLPQMVFAASGALPSLDWMDPDEPPMVGLHPLQEYWVPYGSGTIVIPTSGEFVLNVEGSGQVIPRALSNGCQAVFVNNNFDDPFTNRADSINGGVEGLFPFQSTAPLTEPWEWWDTNHVNHAYAIGLNPGMSHVQGRAYIDTIINYLSPRLICALNLDECSEVVVGLEVPETSSGVKVYPNPAQEIMLVESSQGPIQELRLFSLDGRELFRVTVPKVKRWVLDRKDWENGVYFLSVRTADRVEVKRVVWR